MTVSERPVICQGCREKFIREPGNFEKDSKGFYHKTCHSAMLQERAGREDMLGLVRDALGPTANLAFIQKQLKKFTDQYGFTVSGIKGTIYYFTQVKGNKPRPEFGLAFVPYHYEKARLYFTKMEGMDSITGYKAMEDIQITIKEPSQKRERKLIDLDKLFNEGDFE